MSNNINSMPTLASVMTDAARKVVGKTQSGNSSMKESGRQWAELRLAKSIGASNRGYGTMPSFEKFGQMSTGGMLNNTTTQPNFYSPFLTPSSFQIPNTRKEIYLWSNWWRLNEPKVAAGIDFYKNFPFNGWKLECKSGVVKDYFEKLIEKLNFQKMLPLISGDYYLYGDAFVFTEIDCPHCGGGMIDLKTGKDCEHKGASWKSMVTLNPDSVQITAGFITTEPVYAYLPNDQEVRIVMEKNPKEVYDKIPDQVKAKIMARQPITLNPISIHHFKHGSEYWNDYGVSLVKPLMVTLAYKDKLRQAQWLIAERHIIPTKIVMVGDDNRPASQADLDSVQEQLSAVANDPNLTLVVPHAFKYEFVGASSQILNVAAEFEQLDQEILDGLMLNKGLLNGEGPNYGSAQVGLLAMNERLESWRREMQHFIEQKIFKPCAEWNGFYASGEAGQEELIYPKIIFDPLRLKDNTGQLQMMVTAQQNGVVSAETLVEEFGLNWDQEVERLRFEQGMNFVNAPEIMDTDMNIGFGGVTGAGFGGGPLNQPLTPGAEGGDLGMGEMPPAGGDITGGAPATAPAPEALMPPATADTIYKQYKFASNLVNEICYNRTALAKLEERNYLSEIDRELNERFAVTGRGYFKEIPEDLEPAEPWNWKGAGVPENYEAVKLVKASKVKNKSIIGYTGLEKKLYKLIMSMQPPLAFYAQYEAGPGKEYILDGAFPQIKLAIEADGEIWHNNENKIKSDQHRDTNLSRQGWTVLRFTDKEIERQPKDVAMVIKQAMQKLLGSLSGEPGDQFI